MTIEAMEKFEDKLKGESKKKKRARIDEPSVIAKKICEDNKIIFCAANFYSYRDGVYRLLDDEIMRRMIIDVMGPNVSFNNVNELFNFSRTHTFIETDKLNQSPLLNLKNGLFNPDTCGMSPHSPEHFSTIQIQVNYNPEAKCGKWIQTLYEIFEGDEEKAQTLQEFFGLCLTRETRYAKALICLGEGANGKSLILNVLEELIGRENCAAIPLEKFSDTHYMAHLFGKLANISIETNAKAEVYDSMIKAVSSGDSIEADLKFKDSFKFRPFCKLVFALNNLPRVNDKTNAFFRRLLILRFEREFAEAEQNKRLLEELLPELDGIFNWSLEGLKRLRSRGQFNITKQMQAEIDEYRADNNNVIVFVADECTLDVESAIGKGELYSAYAVFCKESGYRALSKKKFGTELIKHFKEIKDDRLCTGRFWRGIALSGPEYHDTSRISAENAS